MHLGNAAISTECAWLAAASSAAGIAWLARTARRQDSPTALPTIGWTSFVFAAQAWNLPVLPWASAHLVGGVLLARVLGPLTGAWAMGSILAVQALLLGDGGWMAWGCNFVNMALLPALAVQTGDRWLRTNSASAALLSGLIACGTILLAAGLICGEVLLFQPQRLAEGGNFAQQMFAAHLPIGIAEGVLTALLLLGVQTWQTVHPIKQRNWGFAVIAIMAICFAANVWGSSLPDGYEAAVETVGWSILPAERASSWLFEAGLLASGLAVAAGLASGINAFPTRARRSY